MNNEGSNEEKVVPNPWGAARPRHVLFTKSPLGTAFGVVSDSEPSSLALLAAGVAGIAARRARRSERMKSLESHKTEN
jgi:MYXO-CTERM domain-containing protein